MGIVAPAVTVLFGHGSRDPHWRDAMDAVAARIVERQPGQRVVCAFMEMSQPDLPTAVAGLVGEGVQRVTVFPLFLGLGRHAREDLPQLMATIHSRHPDVEINWLPSAGEQPLLTDLLATLALNHI